MSSCESPATLDGKDVCAGRHSCNSTRCEFLNRVCLYNDTIFHHHGGAWQLLNVQVRLPWRSHEVRMYQVLKNDSYLDAESRARRDALLDNAHVQQTSCRPPLLWVPVWSINFSDTLLGTVVPLLELEQLGLCSPATPFIVDLLKSHQGSRCWTDRRSSCDTAPWFARLLNHSIAPPGFLHDLAPMCATASDCRQPVCFSHARFCSMRSKFDMREPPNLDVWSTLQTVVERTLGTEATIENQPGNAGSAASLTGNAKGGHPTSSIDSKDAVPSHKMTRVLFDHRRELGPMKGRMISNVEELLTACRRERAALNIECEEHTFGNTSLAEDMRRVRSADVLVGMHGAGLSNSYFMRRNSSLIEFRPWGFDGVWADEYFRTVFHRARPIKIFHMTISVGSPELCFHTHPRPPRWQITTGVASTTRECKLPWETLRHALGIVRWWRFGPDGPREAHNGPAWRYISGSHFSRQLVAYAPPHG